MKKYLTTRVIILLIVLAFSIIAISPNPFAKGIEIKSIDAADAYYGLSAGQIIYEFNGKEIKSAQDFQEVLNTIKNPEQLLEVKTEKGIYAYNITNEIGFTINENLTILSAKDFTGLDIGEKVKEINGQEFANLSDFNIFLDELLPLHKIAIKTNRGEFAYLSRNVPGIVAGPAQTSNIKLGLELEGGTRVLLSPKTEEYVTDSQIQDLIKVLTNRLNVYGLSDLRVRSAEDWAGNKFVVVEIAGATKEEVKELIGKQGRFEAKINNNIVFEGGRKDIPFVCRDDGSCSGIRQCLPISEGWWCEFYFEITLSSDAAKRHANITRDLEVVNAESGKQILNATLDFYLDNQMVDKLQIGADLKGSETTAIAISGPGYGKSKQEAIEGALKGMDSLQTILITGSLPFDIEVAKMDSISPSLGKTFLDDILLAGLVGLFAVLLVIYIRYRQIKIMLPIMLTMIGELLIILGVAALIKWNIDLPSIVGIIAAIGTGVDDQIVITDEALKGSFEQSINWKEKLKRAFFIILSAYAATVVAMIPLWNAGAGLFRGLAVTTIIGVTAGVFLTRPAFASIIEKIYRQ
ncbi:hypothetical protein HZB88_01450 [archaeon]|nr:hypothetical protein [archaeon]